MFCLFMQLTHDEAKAAMYYCVLCLSFLLPTGTHRDLTMGNSFSNVTKCEMYRLIILMHCAVSECHTLCYSSTTGKLTLHLNIHLIH